MKMLTRKLLIVFASICIILTSISFVYANDLPEIYDSMELRIFELEHFKSFLEYNTEDYKITEKLTKSNYNDKEVKETLKYDKNWNLIEVKSSESYIGDYQFEYDRTRKNHKTNEVSRL